MDPLSVIASIAGILTAAVQISSAATSLISRWKEAPASIHAIVVEMSALGACLAQLKPYLENLNTVPSARTEIISVEHVIVVVSSCVLAISELQNLWDNSEPQRTLTMGNKVWWALHAKKVDSLRSRVQASTSSLNLILTVITCTTTEESRQSINQLERMLDRVLQTDAALSSRIRDYRTEDTSSRDALSISESESELDSPDDVSVVTITRLNSSEDNLSGGQRLPAFGLDPDTEYGLYSSVVYLRAEGRHSLSSLPSVSGMGSTCGWSFCSHFSLAKISTISVLSLPISRGELWNPGQYVERSEKSSSNRPSQVTTYPPHRPTSDDPTAEIAKGFYPYDDNTSRAIRNSRRFRGVSTASLVRGFANEDRPSYYSIKATQDPQCYMVNDEILTLDTIRPGRSTLVRHILGLYHKPWNDIDRSLHRINIRFKLITTFQSLVRSRQARKSDYANVAAWGYEAMILTSSILLNEGFLSILGTAMKELWKEDCIRREFDLATGIMIRSDFSIMMKDIDRVTSAEYIPSDDDILCPYSIFPGDNESFISLKRFGSNRSLRIHDICEGGNIDHVEKAKTVLFVASLEAASHEKVLSRIQSILKQTRFITSRLVLVLEDSLPVFQTEEHDVWQREVDKLASDTKRQVIIHHVNFWDDTYTEGELCEILGIPVCGVAGFNPLFEQNIIYPAF